MVGAVPRRFAVKSSGYYVSHPTRAEGRESVIERTTVLLPYFGAWWIDPFL